MTAITASPRAFSAPSGVCGSSVFPSTGPPSTLRIGVAVEPVPPLMARHLKIPAGQGLLVMKTMPDSPAAGALKEHDILVK